MMIQIQWCITHQAAKRDKYACDGHMLSDGYCDTVDALVLVAEEIL